ncbi:MAG: accessory gene regulator B family protein [Oscillospiraceae bacterium]|nr:accessory gene regulator B family protein [Oscillospiraceae bacterium]
MISFLSHRIAHFLYHDQIIDEEMVPVCQYGFEIIISTGVGVSLVILAGLILGYLKEAVLFYFLFIVIRFYTGGYHAETHFKCKVTLLLCFLVVLLSYILLKNSYCIQIHVALELFYMIIILLFAPVEHLNAPMTKEEEKKNRIISIAMAITFFLEGGMGASGADVEITNVNEETVQISGSGSLNGGETVGVNTFTLYENGHWYLCYYTGDATNDNEVNASDAAKINIMCNSVPGHEMSVSDPNFSTYFPNAPFHGQPDANQSGWINSTDATLILEYSAIVNASPLGEAAYSGCVHQVVRGMQIS